jgi:cytochrome c oxidase subunit 1
VVLFLYIVWQTLRSGEKAAANYWGAGATSLEWMLPSPPPFHSYEELPRIPAEAGH